ncbi:MAG: hypothetical protein AB1646_15730 [Thermodesulfobacteriota bacterium]
MDTYKVFKHAKGNIKALQPGWNWAACSVPGLWALFHELWFIGLLLLFSDACAVAVIMSGYFISYAVGLLMFNRIVMGAIGSWAVEKDLLSRGFYCIGTITTDNADSAIAILAANDKS